MRGRFLGPGGSRGRRESFTHLSPTKMAAAAIMYKYGESIVILGVNLKGMPRVQGSVETDSWAEGEVGLGF